ncbi:hypothetical protein Tco_1221361 [Tanacetum coccineum]
MWQEGSFCKRITKAFKDFEANINKVKAKLALLSSSASASKASMVKNKGLMDEAYEWDKEEVSSDENEMIEVKCISEQFPIQKNNILGVDQLTEDSSSSGQKDLVCVKSSANDTKVSIPGVEKPLLSEAESFIMPNHNTGRILPEESQRNITDPPVAITDSSVTDYSSADISSVYSTPLPLLKKLDGDEPVSRPKTIKSILKSKSTFKAEALKGVILNEPSPTSAKGNKNTSASKVNSAPAGKLKNVKIKDDLPLAIVIKELNKVKLQNSKTQSSYSKNIHSQQISTNEYLHPYEPSQRYQTNSNEVSFTEPYEPVVLETKVSSDQNGQADQNDLNDQNDQSAQTDEILNDDQSEHPNHTNDE